jgi:hypothetical protein
MTVPVTVMDCACKPVHSVKSGITAIHRNRDRSFIAVNCMMFDGWGFHFAQTT